MQFIKPHMEVSDAVDVNLAMAAYEREMTRHNFDEFLNKNPGNIIIKFGAEWCGPCKRIEAHVVKWFDFITNNDAHHNHCIAIDVDESFELYGAFKSRRQISGIPAILHFKKGNISYIPDNLVVGADHEKLNEFFKNVIINTNSDSSSHVSK